MGFPLPCEGTLIFFARPSKMLKCVWGEAKCPCFWWQFRLPILPQQHPCQPWCTGSKHFHTVPFETGHASSGHGHPHWLKRRRQDTRYLWSPSLPAVHWQDRKGVAMKNSVLKQKWSSYFRGKKEFSFRVGENGMLKDIEMETSTDN